MSPLGPGHLAACTPTWLCADSVSKHTTQGGNKAYIQACFQQWCWYFKDGNNINISSFRQNTAYTKVASYIILINAAGMTQENILRIALIFQIIMHVDTTDLVIHRYRCVYKKHVRVYIKKCTHTHTRTHMHFHSHPAKITKPRQRHSVDPGLRDWWGDSARRKDMVWLCCDYMATFLVSAINYESKAELLHRDARVGCVCARECRAVWRVCVVGINMTFRDRIWEEELAWAMGIERRYIVEFSNLARAFLKRSNVNRHYWREIIKQV